MPFIITRASEAAEEEPIQQTQSKQSLADTARGLPKAAIKSVTIPTSRVAEGLAGAAGGTIEMPAALTSQIYSLFGKEPPEWAQGPSPLRLTREGQIIPALRTPSEIREQVTKPLAGKYTEPTNPLESALSDVSDIFTNLRLGGVKGTPTALKGATAAYGVRKGSEEFGIHPFFSIPAEMLVTHGTISKSKVTPEAMTSKGKELAETATKEGITSAPSAILSEGDKGDYVSKFLRSVGAAGETVRERAQQFVEDVENAYHNVLSTIHKPYATERNLKLLKEHAGKMFDPVKDMASKNPLPLNTQNLITAVDRNIAKINKSKSLTPGEKQALKILEDFKGELQKPFTLENGEATYRSFNKHVKDWDSITKNDTHLIDVKKAISNEMMDVGKNVPGFNEAFNVANVGYHNLSNLENATQVLKSSFDATGKFDPHRFINTVKNSENRSELIRLMGKPSVDRMTKIADLTKAAAKNFDAVGASFSEEMGSQHKQLGMSMGLVKHVVAKVVGNIPSRILTNPNLQQNYLGYLRSLKNNSPKVAAYYMRQMKKDLAEETSEEVPEGRFIINE